MAGWFSMFWITSILLTAGAARADIYFWEDRQGVIHFSNEAAPPEASLYMREIPTPPAPEPTETPVEADREASARELARKQAQTQKRLEEANRKLNDALERVDALTDSVARSRARAEAAADAARQAELEARAARDYQSDDRERVTVYAVPYRPYKSHHQYKRHGNNHRNHKYERHRSRPLHRDKSVTSRHIRSRSGIEKSKTHRRSHFRYNIPGPVLPPDGHRIPKAYGIR